MKQNWSKYPLLGLGSAVVAFVFALLMVFGAALDSVGEIRVKSMVSWVSVAVLFLGTFGLLFGFLSKIREGSFPIGDTLLTDNTETETGKQALFRNLGTWGLLFLCWIPSFLAVYPGYFLYDAYEEFMQVETGVFSMHHPLLHVLLLGKTIRAIYRATGSYNYGIAVFILVQMMVIAACFAFVLYRMKQNGVPKRWRRILFCYFAFFPMVVMFSMCSTKDVLFAAMLVVCVLQYISLQNSQEEIINTPLFWIVLGGAQVFALLLRNNAVYAFVVFAVLLLFVCKGRRKRILILSVVTLLCYGVCSKGLAIHLNATESGKQEMLTVAIQQISRSYRADREYLSAEDKETLFRILPEEAIERYTPKLSDPVKVHFDNDAYQTDKAGFWKIWWKLFKHNPVGYVNAWFMTSYGYWYPDATVDVYNGSSVFTHSYEISSYFGFETEEPGIRKTMLPGLESFFKEISLEDVVQKIPGISWMFSMGCIAWLYVVGACILVAKKAYRSLVPFAFPALVWMTLLLGPTYLPRYVVFLWYLLPVMVTEVMRANK